MCSEYSKILEHNYGFKEINSWLNYAREKNFKFVKYTAVNFCPDCGEVSQKKIGQFVYYSTLHSLLECLNCKLWYVDVLIDESVRAAHFEVAYKAEDYFKESRKDIFLQTLDLLDSKDKSKSLILELGGATGELLLLIKNKYPESKVVLNDISADACQIAKSKGLEVIPGTISKIEKLDHCSAVIALDVLYYEPELKICFDKTFSILKPDGVLILRFPNKYSLIKLLSFFGEKKLQTKITFFNPEHLYVFTRKYLTKKLKSIGYSRIEFSPSALLRKKNNTFFVKLFYVLAEFIYKLTGIIITPSFFVVAYKA